MGAAGRWGRGGGGGGGGDALSAGQLEANTAHPWAPSVVWRFSRVLEKGGAAPTASNRCCSPLFETSLPPNAPSSAALGGSVCLKLPERWCLSEACDPLLYSSAHCKERWANYRPRVSKAGAFSHSVPTIEPQGERSRSPAFSRVFPCVFPRSSISAGAP